MTMEPIRPCIIDPLVSMDDTLPETAAASVTKSSITSPRKSPRHILNNKLATAGTISPNKSKKRRNEDESETSAEFSPSKNGTDNDQSGMGNGNESEHGVDSDVVQVNQLKCSPVTVSNKRRRVSNKSAEESFSLDDKKEANIEQVSEHNVKAEETSDANGSDKDEETPSSKNVDVDKASTSNWRTNLEDDLSSRAVLLPKIVEVLLLLKTIVFTNNPEAVGSVAKTLELGLYKNAKSKEDYLNLTTLEDRIKTLLSADNSPLKPLQGYLKNIKNIKGNNSHREPKSEHNMKSENESLKQNVLPGHNVDKNTQMYMLQNDLLKSGLMLSDPNDDVLNGYREIRPKSRPGVAQSSDIVKRIPDSSKSSNRVKKAFGADQKTELEPNGSVASINSKISIENSNDHLNELKNMKINNADPAQVIEEPNSSVVDISASSSKHAKVSFSADTKTNTIPKDCKQLKLVVRLRQQRLLLLYHASQCSQVNCEVSPHCLEMRALWHHLSICSKNECDVAHCISSRCLIIHYQSCRRGSCKVCQPVRFASSQQHPHSVRDFVRKISKNSTDDGELSSEVGHNPVYDDNQIDPKVARHCVSGTGPNLIYFMSIGQIAAHLSALKVEKLQMMLFPLLRKLMENKNNKDIFNAPVDVVAYNIPHYFNIVKHPMDFGTIRQRLEDGKYSNIVQFDFDVRLVCNNAMLFNPESNFIHSMAQSLLKYYELEVNKLSAVVGLQADRSLAISNTVSNEKCNLCYQEQCEVCPLCERGCIAFEPRVIYCSGNCNSRIGRNSYYYATPTFSYCFCTECYEKHRRKNVIEASGGLSCNKQDLERKKNNELSAEPWVSCDRCFCWAHQICALYNPRKDDPKLQLRYVCPSCLTKEKQAKLKSSASAVEVKKENTTDAEQDSITNVTVTISKQPRPLFAPDLKHSHLSIFLERWIRSYYTKFQKAEQANPPSIPCEPGPDASKLHVRILHNYDEVCKVKAFARKAMPKLPSSFRFRSKCIVLFQELDGVDVLIFALFVQEYGSDAGEPNANKLYIAYLDSVHYFRPRRLRTAIYHELLLSYLEYSRRLGFVNAYIWACPPPNKRDDYIIHSHPEDQRVPNSERLRKWYHQMIVKGRKFGIIANSSTLYDEHFDGGLAKDEQIRPKRRKKLTSNFEDFEVQGAGTTRETKSGTKNALKSTSKTRMCKHDSSEQCDNKSLDNGRRDSDLFSTSFVSNSNDDIMQFKRHAPETNRALDQRMPYFEGDYWPQELEEIAKDEEHKRSKRTQNGSAIGNTYPRLAQQKKSGLEKGLPEKTETNLDNCDLKDLTSDQLREILIGRLSTQLSAMKQDFLLVKLALECVGCGAYIKGKRFECRHRECLISANQDPGSCSTLESTVELLNEKSDGSLNKTEVKQYRNQQSKFILCENCYQIEMARPKRLQHCMMNFAEELSESELSDDSVNVLETSDIKIECGVAQVPTVGSSSVSDLDMLKTDLFPPECNLISTHKFCDLVNNSLHELVEITEVVSPKTFHIDEPCKNTFLETRHTFLALCSGNRYQFNQLRRAKHSTMMVLYHLHNPDAPAHLFTCNKCNEDILKGKRFHCQECIDFNLCETCYASFGHEHKVYGFLISRGIKMSAITHGDLPDNESGYVYENNPADSRRIRHQSKFMFIESFEHSSRCVDSNCEKSNCRKLKALILHSKECTVSSSFKNCEICRRLFAITTLHSKRCRRDDCDIHLCRLIKEQKRYRQEREKLEQEAKLDKTKPSVNKSINRDGNELKIKLQVIGGTNGTKIKIKPVPLSTQRYSENQINLAQIKQERKL